MNIFTTLPNTDFVNLVFMQKLQMMSQTTIKLFYFPCFNCTLKLTSFYFLMRVLMHVFPSSSTLNWLLSTVIPEAAINIGQKTHSRFGKPWRRAKSCLRFGFPFQRRSLICNRPVVRFCALTRFVPFTHPVLFQDMSYLLYQPQNQNLLPTLSNKFSLVFCTSMYWYRTVYQIINIFLVPKFPLFPAVPQVPCALRSTVMLWALQCHVFAAAHYPIQTYLELPHRNSENSNMITMQLNLLLGLCSFKQVPASPSVFETESVFASTFQIAFLSLFYQVAFLAFLC